MTRRRAIKQSTRGLAVHTGDSVGPTDYDLFILTALETGAR
jgi:hypothetical protein